MLLCGLTWQGKACECHPAHWFLLIIILGGYMLLLDLPPRAFIAFGTLFLRL